MFVSIVHFWNMLQQIVRKGKGLFFKDPASPVRSWNSSPPRTVTPDPNDWSDDEYDCVQDLSTNVSNLCLMTNFIFYT